MGTIKGPDVDAVDETCIATARIAHSLSETHKFQITERILMLNKLLLWLLESGIGININTQKYQCTHILLPMYLYVETINSKLIARKTHLLRESACHTS